jgi:predicted nucleic acid-binding protein
MFLFDSDFLFSYFFADQSTGAKAKIIGARIITQEVFMLSITLQELGTVISRKKSKKEAIEIIDWVMSLNLDFIRPTLEDENQIWQLFKSFDKKNISYIDCANLYFAKKNNYKIATFDAFYPQDMIVEF